MKMMNSSSILCAELASNLTRQYFSPAQYAGGTLQQQMQPPQSLPEYLTQTGVLITICLLSPEDCDAITNMRNRNGCGSFFDKEQHQSIPWWKRIMAKVRLLYHKYRCFPTTPWEDIPCSKLFSENYDPDFTGSRALLINHNLTTWKSFTWYQKQMCETMIMKHTVCYDDTEPDFDDRTLLLYVGDEPWKPEEWNMTMANMKKIIDEHPTSFGIWNEIVFQMTPNGRLSREMVQAIFYYGSDFREEAIVQAGLIGQVPLLELNPLNPDQHIFRCAEDDPEEQDDGLAVE